jgi:hypothetical protein
MDPLAWRPPFGSALDRGVQRRAAATSCQANDWGVLELRPGGARTAGICRGSRRLNVADTPGARDGLAGGALALPAVAAGGQARDAADGEEAAGDVEAIVVPSMPASASGGLDRGGRGDRLGVRGPGRRAGQRPLRGVAAGAQVAQVLLSRLGGRVDGGGAGRAGCVGELRSRCSAPARRPRRARGGCRRAAHAGPGRRARRPPDIGYRDRVAFPVGVASWARASPAGKMSGKLERGSRR